MKQHFKTKLTIGAILLAATIAGTVYANAPEHAKDGGHCKEFSKKGGHDGLPPFLKGIELSNEQKTQITTLMKQEHASAETHHQQRGALMKDLHQVSNAETFNAQQAENIANQLANLEKEEFLTRARNGHKIFSLLTPEQRQKANENIKKHMEKMDSMKIKPVNFQKNSSIFPNKING